MMSFLCSDIINAISPFIDAEIKSTVEKTIAQICDNYKIERISADLTSNINNLPDCYEMYFVSKRLEGLADSSLDWYDKILRQFFNHVKKSLNAMTTNDIRLFLYHFKTERNASDSYVDTVRCIIGSFMSWCTDNEYLDRNISRPIKKVKFEKYIRQPLTDVELEMFRHSYRNCREEAICEMIYSTGCRVSELCSLNISDINFDTREVKLFGKGRKHRSSYMSIRARHSLQLYLNTRTDNNEALFVALKRNTRISKSGCEFVVKKIAERSGIKRSVYPHLLRHTFATNALKRGISVQDISKLLGHANIETTMIYAKTCQDSIKHQHELYLV